MGFLKPIIGAGDVRLVMRSGSMRELLQMLDTHHIDILLTNTSPPREHATGWVSHLIADQPISLVGPKAGRGRKRSLENMLRSEPLIVPTMENHIRADFDALMDRMGVRPHIAAEVDDMAMLRLLSREGLGYAIVPPIVVRDELKSGALAEFGPLPELRESFFAITPTRRFPNPLIGALMAANMRSGPRRRPAVRRGT